MSKINIEDFQLTKEQEDLVNKGIEIGIYKYLHREKLLTDYELQQLLIMAGKNT